MERKEEKWIDRFSTSVLLGMWRPNAINRDEGQFSTTSVLLDTGEQDAINRLQYYFSVGLGY